MDNETQKELQQKLEQSIADLNERIMSIEKKQGVNPTNNIETKIEKKSITEFDLIKVNKIVFDSFYYQNDEPTIPLNSFSFWYDADGTAYYLIFNFNGTQKKVSLT